MLSILHSGDWHIREQDIDEGRKCLEFLVSKAAAERPDLILLPGDLTDSKYCRFDTQTSRLILWAVRRLAEVAPTIVCVGTDYHDGLIPEILADIGIPETRLFVTSKPAQAVLDEAGRIHQLPFDVGPTAVAVVSIIPSITKQYFQSGAGISDSDDQITAQASALMGAFAVGAQPYDAPHILMGHWSVRGAKISDTQQMIGREIEFGLDQIALAEADLVCLGHIHLHQDIAGFIFYSGSLYRKDFGELEDKGFYIHELAKIPEDAGWHRTESRFVETPTRKMLKIEADFTDGTDIKDLEMTCYTYSEKELSGAHVWADFSAYTDEAEALDRESIRDFFLSGGAERVRVTIHRIPRANVRSEHFMRLETLPEKLEERARIKEEKIDPQVLDLARDLELKDPAEIIDEVSKL